MEKYYDINAKGCSIRCKQYFNKGVEVAAVVIACHGFGGEKESKAIEKFAVRALSKHKDWSVIAFDWPCHGTDGRKKLCLDDCNMYLKLVIEDVMHRFGDVALYNYSTSFGGYLSLKYMLDNGNPFRKLVLRCPAVCMYASMYSNILSQDNIEALQAGKDTLVGYDRQVKISPIFIDEIKDYDIQQKSFLDFADDIMIIHGTKDEIIPYGAAYEFAEENVIEFITVENADHRFVNPGHMDIAIASALRFMT